MGEPSGQSQKEQSGTRFGVRILTVEADDVGQRIDNFLMNLLKTVPRSRVYRLIRTGQVRVNGGRIKPLYKLQQGDQVRVPPLRDASPRQVRVPDSLVVELMASVIFENEDYVAFNKPCGVAVHAGSGLQFGVIDAVRQHYRSSSFELVHRLDRGTSGCLLIGKSRRATGAAQQAFREGRVRKVYQAVVCDHWLNTPCTVTLPLLANAKSGGERRVVVSEEGKAATSHFKLLDCIGSGPGSDSGPSGIACSQVQVSIETGRTHQIRVHAAQSGHPVVGDTRYGNAERNKQFRQSGLKRLYLHSSELELLGEPAISIGVDCGWQQDLEQLTR